MALAGKVNKHLVQLISKHGGKAIGLCGIDGEKMKAEKYTKSDVGFVGEITEIDTDVIDYTLENKNIPVISSVATGENGEVFNINADTAAAAIAASIHADLFLLMNDICELLMDKDYEYTTVRFPKYRRSSLRALSPAV